MDDDAVNEIMFGVLLEIDEHLCRKSDATMVESEDLFEFVNTTDRMSLYRKLRDDPETPEEVAAVLGPQSKISKDLFHKLREACGGIEIIGTDPEKRAEVDELLATLEEITTREGPPSINDLSTTETAVNEPRHRIVSLRIREGLNSVEPQRFYSAWGSVPDLYEAELRDLIAVSSRSEVLFGKGVIELMTEELVNTHSATRPYRTVRHWVNSIAQSQTNSVTFYEADEAVPGSLFIFDEYVIAGYFARKDSPLGAFLVTDNPAFREWAVKVYQDWRGRSQNMPTPLLFRGENPYLEEDDANDQQSDLYPS